jgi:oligoendopeptidase F
MKTKSEIFKAAHKLAKTFIGNYAACFSLALTEIYSQLKNSNMEKAAFEAGKTYSVIIDFKDVKVREQAKKNWGAKWNPTQKTWDFTLKSQKDVEAFPIFIQRYKLEINAKKVNRMTYEEAYEKFGFDFAEEGNYTGI